MKQTQPLYKVKFYYAGQYYTAYEVTFVGGSPGSYWQPPEYPEVDCDDIRLDDGTKLSTEALDELYENDDWYIAFVDAAEQIAEEEAYMSAILEVLSSKYPDIEWGLQKDGAAYMITVKGSYMMHFSSLEEIESYYELEGEIWL